MPGRFSGMPGKGLGNLLVEHPIFVIVVGIFTMIQSCVILYQLNNKAHASLNMALGIIGLLLALTSIGAGIFLVTPLHTKVQNWYSKSSYQTASTKE